MNKITKIMYFKMYYKIMLLYLFWGSKIYIFMLHKLQHKLKKKYHRYIKKVKNGQIIEMKEANILL